MATFIVLMRFTEQGIKAVKGSPGRYEEFLGDAKKAGVNVKSVYWTVGHYDLVTTLEGTDEAVTTVLLKVGMRGNVRTETLRGYSLDEMKGLVGKLG